MLAFEVLPKLTRDAESQRLAEVVEQHLEQTREHAARVEEAFRAAGVEPSSNRSASAAALFDEHEALAGQIVEARLRDVFHASAAAQVERYELGLYDALTRLGDALRLDDAVELLRRNRGDELDALAELERQHDRLTAEVTEPSA
jgi:ferritin-like metal-binding protein YciE